MRCSYNLSIIFRKIITSASSIFIKFSDQAIRYKQTTIPFAIIYPSYVGQTGFVSKYFGTINLMVPWFSESVVRHHTTPFLLF